MFPKGTDCLTGNFVKGRAGSQLINLLDLVGVKHTISEVTMCNFGNPQEQRFWFGVQVAEDRVPRLEGPRITTLR